MTRTLFLCKAWAIQRVCGGTSLRWKRGGEAARLLGQGFSQSEVARAVGVHRHSVSRWARELEQSGVRGLCQAKRTGRPPKLSAAQLRALARGQARVRGVRVRQRAVDRESRARSHQVSDRCAIPRGPVWRILRKLNWTCQRPSGRRWSATRRRSGGGRKSRACGSKKALCERRSIVFIDENGLSERPHRVRTVSIIGETMASWEPELRCTAGLNPTQLCRMQPKGASSGAGLPHLDGADRVEQHQDVERDVVADPEGQQQFEQYQEQD